MGDKILLMGSLALLFAFVVYDVRELGDLTQCFVVDVNADGRTSNSELVKVLIGSFSVVGILIWLYRQQRQINMLEHKLVGALGGHLKVMSTTVEFTIPSTSGINQNITPEDFEIRVSLVSEKFAEMFGGCTVSAVRQGAYKAQDGLVIHEKVRVVASYMEPNRWVSQRSNILQFAHVVCDEWSQECIAVSHRDGRSFHADEGIIFVEGTTRVPTNTQHREFVRQISNSA